MRDAMTGVGADHLESLYAATDDPWGFRSSAYEQAKFAATRAALIRPRYRSGLEIGCGNGELARHLAPLCTSYHGVDAVERALAAARCTVPEGRFHRVHLPGRLPGGAHDLIVLSEILYFLDPAGIAALAGQIGHRWHGAELVCVTWLGPTGHALQGEEAYDLFRLASSRPFRPAARTRFYRIDVSQGAS